VRDQEENIDSAKYKSRSRGLVGSGTLFPGRDATNGIAPEIFVDSPTVLPLAKMNKYNV
jgi:hypothetical protein